MEFWFLDPAVEMVNVDLFGDIILPELVFMLVLALVLTDICK